MVKVRIGSEYRRPWFVTRTPIEFASFHGPTTPDEDRVQRALLDHHNRVRLDAEARHLRRVLLGYIVVLCVAIYFGVIR